VAEKTDKIAGKQAKVLVRTEKSSAKVETNPVKMKDVRAKTVKAKEKEKGHEKDKAKKPNFVMRWWRETIGELRKVSWPTPKEAWRLTRIVLIVMVAMSALLGVLNLLFSKIISLVLG